MDEIWVNRDEVIRPWLRHYLQISLPQGKGQLIALARNGEILGAVCVEEYNGANCLMHVAGKPGARWCKPTFLRFCFLYVFDQLGCRRVTGLVDETNVAARRLDEHLGFELETRLKQATPNGDLLVYVMWKEKCRWIRSNQNVAWQG